MVAKFVDLNNIFLDRDGYLPGRKLWVTFVFLSAIMHRMSIFSLFSAILMRSRNFATVTTSSLYKLTQVKGSRTSISHSLPCGADGRADGHVTTRISRMHR